MTWHLYAHPDGRIDAVEYQLELSLFSGFVYLGEYNEKPDVNGKKYENGQLVQVSSPFEYAYQRRMAYPSYGEQFDMLWHAMDNEQIPRVEPFYSQIKGVKDQFPKT
jgi:hypothetical protein